MQKANNHQPGGTHYRSGLQHWDWALRNHMDPLTYAASKYIARWRKKDGSIALEKAAHYVLKASELFSEGVLLGTGVHCVSMEEFARANDLTEKEAEICAAMVTWRTYEDLRRVYNLIFELRVNDISGAPTSEYVNQDR